MNILTDTLQDSIDVSGKKYPIRTDFRVWLEFDRIMNLNIKPEKKFVSIIRLCFDKTVTSTLPNSLEDVMDKLVDFFSCGKGGKRSKAKGNKVLDYEEDSAYIYSAFLTQYSIDLIDIKYMHWHKFSALLKGLDENIRLMKIIGYRSINLSDVESEERRKFYREMKELYALPEKRTKSEIEYDFASTLSLAF